MSIYVILKLKIVHICSYQLLAILFVNSFNGIQHILSHVFISVLLKNISGKGLFVIGNNMNEVTKFSSGTTHWPMVILAWNGSIVPDIDQSLFTRSLHLVTGHLLLFQLFSICTFELSYHRFDTLDVVLMLEFQLNHGKIFKLITLKRDLGFDQCMYKGFKFAYLILI